MSTEQSINFKHLIEQFANNSDFSVEIDSGNAPVEMQELEEDIASILQEFNIEPADFALPQAIKEQLCLYNKLFVRWYKPNLPIMGSFYFPHLVKMLESKISMEGKTLFLFDDFQDMWKVYIHLETETLYFANLYENTYLPMRIDIPTYYDKLAMCMGLTNWQEFFMEDFNYESNKGVKEEFESHFKKLFPNILLAEFKKI